MAYWSISTTMRSDNKAISAVVDALGLGAAKVDVTYAAMEAVVDLVSEFKTKLIAAREPGVDKLKINSELGQLRDQMRSVVESASFSRENWLILTEENWQGWMEPKEVVGSFTRSASGSVEIGTIKYGLGLPDAVQPDKLFWLIDDTLGANTGESGILSTDQFAIQLGSAIDYVLLHTKGAAHNTMGTEIELTATTTEAEIDDMIMVVDAMHSRVIDVAATLGSLQARLDLQAKFTDNLMDTIGKGIGRLVDADMNEASMRLRALQTQEQLSTQALQIANADAQNILSLFR